MTTSINLTQQSDLTYKAEISGDGYTMEIPVAALSVVPYTAPVVVDPPTTVSPPATSQPISQPQAAPLQAKFKVAMDHLTGTVTDQSSGGVPPYKVHYTFADSKTADCAGGEAVTHAWPDTSQRLVVQ